MKNILKPFIGSIAIICAFIAIGSAKSEACSRVIYKGDSSLFIIGRSLDWKTPIPTNVYVYPRGMNKQGSDKPGAVKWKSKYGAVYAVSYDAGVTEGMNEKGLSVNGLFCRGTIYNNPTNDNRPPMSLSMFPAWILDMCADVNDVKALLKDQNFTLTGASFDEGTATALHWGATDAKGNTVVIEFHNGNINIYDVTDIQAMTNDPTWPEMIAIINYWGKIGGKNMLPGTVSSPDRCVRGNYFAHNVKKTADADLGASICRTVLFNCCVPYEYNVPGEPNVSMTQWRSFSNLRDKRYYFDMAIANGFYYIDLNKINLNPGAPVRKLTSADNLNTVGEANSHLKISAPFTPSY